MRGGGVPRGPGDLAAQVVAFTRTLRANGLPLGPGEARDALRALLAVDLADRDEVYLALRTVLVHRPEDYPTFDAVFGALWEGAGGGAAPDAAALPAGDAGGREVRLPGATGAGAELQLLGSELGSEEVPAPTSGGSQDVRPDQPETGEGTVRVAYSPHAAGLERDFATIRPDEVEAMRAVCARLARRLATRWTRRWRRTARPEGIDRRRTLRRAVARGGEVLELPRRRRRRERAQLVVVADVSGSMEPYSRFLLQFLLAFSAAVPRLDAFVFSTALWRVTGALRRGADPARVLDGLAALVRDWGGGTRIGACLEALVRDYGSLFDRRTVVVIGSDGLDTGDVDRLEAAMAALRRRVRRVVWLNPLAGDPRYAPLARGMRAALPYTDVLAPGHSLQSLLALERHLS